MILKIDFICPLYYLFCVLCGVSISSSNTFVIAKDNKKSVCSDSWLTIGLRVVSNLKRCMTESMDFEELCINLLEKEWVVVVLGHLRASNERWTQNFKSMKSTKVKNSQFMQKGCKNSKKWLTLVNNWPMLLNSGLTNRSTPVNDREG